MEFCLNKLEQSEAECVFVKWRRLRRRQEAPAGPVLNWSEQGWMMALRGPEEMSHRATRGPRASVCPPLVDSVTNRRRKLP